MSIHNGQNEPLDTKPELPKLALASIIIGILAILSVIAELLILIFIWSGNENSILNFFFLLLPVTASGAGVLGAFLGIGAIIQKASNKVLGIVGILVSSLTFFLWCCLFGFFFIASGGGMGL